MRPLLRSIGHMGLFLQAAWVITGKGTEWLFYLSLILLVGGISYNMIDDWRRGEKRFVMTQLIVGGVFLLLISIYVAVKEA